MSVIEVRNLSAGYRGQVVLDGIDLSFDPGLHLLLGHNGAGKTTLFRSLSGVLRPIAGEVLIDGRDPHREPDVKLRVGVGAHRAALGPRLTVADNLFFWARVLGVAEPIRTERVTSALSALDLDPIAGSLAGSLSRGQAQRVSLARALLGDPLLILLDEPFSGVDPEVASQLRDHLRALAADGRTLIVSTHELAHANEIGDDVTVLRGGRVIAEGSTAALRSQLVGEQQVIRIRGRGDLADVLVGLGYDPQPDAGDAVRVTVSDEAEIERLVTTLVGEGIGVRELGPAENPLEHVYLGLEREAARAR